MDSRALTSLYIASDSRISWGPQSSWDIGRKVLPCSSHPDLFGFCGDVGFPALALDQLVALADRELIFQNATAEVRHATARQLLEDAVKNHPFKTTASFTVLHGSRDGEGMASQFRLWRLDWSVGGGWRDAEIPIPHASTLLISLGSGGGTVRDRDLKWNRSDVGRTSRAVFGAFCDAIQSGIDPYTGGAPQLAGLYQRGPARTFGVVFRNENYVFGLPVQPAAESSLEWRNESFERSDGFSRSRLPTAQAQPRPRDL